jgi:hypothetical protein
MNRQQTIGVQCVEWVKNALAINQQPASSAIDVAAAP